MIAAGLVGCAGDSDQQTPNDDGLTDLGVDTSELGVALPSCSAKASSGFGAGQVLTLALTTGGAPSTIILSATSTGKIVVNGYPCVNSAGTALTTTGAAATAVKKIVVTGTAGASEKVILDMLPASFGSVIFSGATGTGLDIDLGAGQTDSFMIRGTAGADKIVMGDASGVTYADINGDNKADVKIAGAEAYTVTLLGGNDTFTATGSAGATVTAASLTTGVTSLGAMATAVTVFGGDGNDTLEGGQGNDTLNGGDGNDTFKSAVKDGADVYIGGNGVDTMDYSGRTNPVKVTLGNAMPVITGSVALVATGLSAALDTKTLLVDVDASGSPTTVTFATPATPADVVLQINAAIPGIASLDAGNHLVLTHAFVSGSTATLNVTAGTGLAALGLSTGAVAAAASNDDGDIASGGEKDDVSYTVENILGGAGDDVLVGSDQTNVITGNAGNDTINGVANANCAAAANGDILNGGAGDDVFLMGSAPNCWVVVNGGSNAAAATPDRDTVDFSQRTGAINVSLDGTANDGDTAFNSNAGEKANISATDIEVVIGGRGNDILTGSTHADELHGGPGNDIINGGAGDDLLYGESGNDTINGDAGDDLIVESGTYTTAVTATLNASSTAGSALSGTPTAYGNVLVKIVTGGTTGGTAVDYKISVDGGTTFWPTVTGADASTIAVYGVTLTLGGSKVVTANDTFAWQQDGYGYGNDIINGGAGNDKVDYSGRSANLTVTLCVDPAITGAPTANPLPAECADKDGDPAATAGALPVTGAAASSGAISITMGSTASLATGDQVVIAGVTGTTEANGTWTITVVDATHITLNTSTFTNAYTSGGTVTAKRPEGDNLVNIEWLVSGSGNDTLTGSSADETIEGGAGNDTIHGGAGNDTLYGDAGNDKLYGDDGDDYLEGGTSTTSDALDGGNGDGDICVGGVQTTCEL